MTDLADNIVSSLLYCPPSVVYATNLIWGTRVRFVRKMAAVTRIRPRYVVTLPRSLRHGRRIKVGDNVVWLPVSDREFLAVVLPSDRYQVLADLMSGIDISHEARLAAEHSYFSSAAKKASWI